MQAIRLKNEPSYKAIHDAFDYQRRALSFVKELEYAAIFHEQGLGKTKIAIDLSLAWISEKQLDTILIVTKKSLIANWINEFKVHSHINPKVLTGNKAADGNVLLSPARIIVCHYELFKRFESSIKLFCETRDVGIFLDESHKIKNPTSALTNVFFRLSRFFKKRIIVTGTPIANRPYDIWSQIYFLDMGGSLGDDFHKFKSENELTNDLCKNNEQQNEFADSLNRIFPKISNFTIRETKAGCSVGLPQKNFIQVFSSWESRQWDLYNDIKNDFRTYVQKEGQILNETAEGVLKRILRLQQICSMPSLIDDSYKSKPGKLSDLDEIMDEITTRNEKVIVWTQFTGVADLLTKYLNEYGAKKITGKMTIDNRNKNINLFLTNKSIRCLVATYGAAKEGLTLTVANNAIFFDRSLRLDDYIQSQDRIHRISQTKSCNFYILEMEDSIELWVRSLLNAKMCSASFALKDIDRHAFQECMSFEFGEDLKKILGADDV